MKHSYRQLSFPSISFLCRAGRCARILLFSPLARGRASSCFRNWCQCHLWVSV